MTPPKLPGDAPISKQQKKVIIKKNNALKYLQYQKPSYITTQAVQNCSKRECLAQNPPLLLVGHKTPRGPVPLNFFPLGRVICSLRFAAFFKDEMHLTFYGI